MRIISGASRGTKLYTLEGLNTRPTLDRVKESVFNIIQDHIADSIFLDLFSGSGAIGLEAASRGARNVILCDNSKSAIEIINKNVSKTHLENKVKIYNLDFEKALNRIKQDFKTIDIIYLDPPYDSDYVIKALQLINNLQLVNNNTKIIIETDQEDKLISQLEKTSFEINDRRKYGRAVILFLEYEENI